MTIWDLAVRAGQPYRKALIGAKGRVKRIFAGLLLVAVATMAGGALGMGFAYPMGKGEFGPTAPAAVAAPIGALVGFCLGLHLFWINKPPSARRD